MFEWYIILDAFVQRPLYSGILNCRLFSYNLENIIFKLVNIIFKLVY